MLNFANTLVIIPFLYSVIMLYHVFLTNIYSITQEQFELCDAYCTSTVVPFFIQLSVLQVSSQDTDT